MEKGGEMMNFDELAEAYEICANLRNSLEISMNDTGNTSPELFSLKDEIIRKENQLLNEMDMIRAQQMER